PPRTCSSCRTGGPGPRGRSRGRGRSGRRRSSRRWAGSRSRPGRTTACSRPTTSSSSSCARRFARLRSAVGRSILVTGGAGFIGSHLVDLLLERPDTTVTVLDKLTYAGSRRNVAPHERNPRFRFVVGDVADPRAVEPLVHEADAVVHAAAESFVDRSIEDSKVFVES